MVEANPTDSTNAAEALAADVDDRRATHISLTEQNKDCSPR